MGTGKHALCTLRLFTLLFSIFWAASGCSSKGLIPGFKPDAPPLQKRVMLSPIVDFADVGTEEASQIDARFLDLLLKAPSLRLYRTPEDMVAPPRPRSPEFGIVTYPELVQKASELEMNALITGTLNPVEVSTKKIGVWPFRDSAKVFDISMVVNAVDVASGCLYLSNLESEKIVIPLDKGEGLDEKGLLKEALDRAIPRILGRQATALRDKLRREPWSGKILSVNHGAITINGGKEIGVRPGQLFAVHAQGESILCRDGSAMDVLGRKVGEIKTTSVGSDRSDAVPVSGGPFADGQIVRFLR